MNMEFVHRTLREIAARRDGQAHRIILTSDTPRYTLPLEIIVHRDLTAIAVASITPKPVPARWRAATTALMAPERKRGGPNVLFNVESGIISVGSTTLLHDLLEDPDDLWEVIEPVVVRMMSFVYRVDLVAQGLEREVVAQLREFELANWDAPLRRYRPFAKAPRRSTRR
jgi:hypothetical protein